MRKKPPVSFVNVSKDMRIGIDARFYGPLGKGLGRYTERLIHHLQALRPAEEFVIFLRKENWEAFQPTVPTFTKVLADFPWYTVAEQRGMPRVVANAKVDLMHYPHFNVPFFTPRPFVVTIHDLILTHFPTRRATTLGPLKYAVKQLGYQLTLSRAVSRAAKIITVSEFTKQDIRSYFGYDPKKIVVTYEAVDPFPETMVDVPAVLQKYDIRQPYLLYVGNAYPHKNLEKLIALLHELPAAQKTLQLVIIGKADYFQNRIRQLVHDAGIGNRVRFPGYVPDTELGVLYQQAHAFIFPSLYEGFGLPPLEAMAYGTPVLSSDAACMKEILGKAALYFNPNATRGMLAALQQLESTPELRSQLIAAGKQQVAQYRWQNLAESTLRVYRDTLS